MVLPLQTQERESKKFSEVAGLVAVNVSDVTFVGIVRFDPDDSQPTYIGTNANALAQNTDGSWKISKFTYSGSNTTSIQTVVGVWSDRATLF